VHRYEVVDPEHGVVVGLFRFDTPGTVLTRNIRGAGVVPIDDPSKRPRSVMVTEAFKVINGQIALIDAQMVDVPYKMPDVW
jgi:hypothetical protein